MTTTQATNVGAAERLGSIAVGGLLVAQAFRNRSLAGLAGAATGAGLLYRGATGHCPMYSALGLNTARNDKPGSEVGEQAPRVRRSITIGKPPEELIRFWRDPKNLARINEHWAEVTAKSEDLTHWRVKAPANLPFEWDSQQTVSPDGRSLQWQSLPGTELPNKGSITFQPAPDSLGTVVILHMLFEPPLGSAGAQFAKALHKVPRAIGGKSLRRFKSLVEAGEIPTLAHNPSGLGSSDSF